MRSTAPSWPAWVVAFICACATTAPRVGAAAEHDLEVAASGMPAAATTATSLVVPVSVENRGDVAWSAAGGFAFAYHWFDHRGEAVVWDGVRTELSAPVNPGERRSLEAVVRTPDMAGDYLLQWDVVREGVLWLSEADPTPVAPVPVTVTATHAFSVLDIEMPRVLIAGGARRARLALRNDGAIEWPADGPVSIAYHWLGGGGEVVVWEGRRTSVDRRAKPGETVIVEATVSAPETAGRYRLQWDMVEDGVCWFAERDGEPEPAVVVLVVPPTLVSPAAWTLMVLAAAAAVLVTRLRTGSPTAPGLWAVADIVWWVAAVTLKQAWVLIGAGVRPSLAGWCLSLAGAAAVGLLLVVLPVRRRRWFTWCAAAFATSILYADVLYLRFFDDLVSAAAMPALAQVGRLGASVRSLLEVGDLWFWADLPAAAVLFVGIAGLPGARLTGRRVAVVLAAVALVGSAVGALALRGRTESLRQVFHTTHLARHIGVLNHHAVDFGGAVIRIAGGQALDDQSLAEVVRYFEDLRSSRAGTGPAFAAAAGHNLVMIQAESLQAFVVGYRIGDREVTPFLNQLASDGFWFANVTDQTEEGRSSDSELATQVSLLPPDRGAAAFLHAGNDFTGLASILGERDYTTLSAVPFDGSFWNRRITHRAYGFERSLFVDDFAAAETIGWGLNDRAFLSQAAGRLAELPEPWCVYLLTLSLHHPFEGFPEEHKVLDVGDWEGTPFGNFLHTMHYLDGALAAFVQALDRAGLLERTVIAVWGDHDAGFAWRPEIAAAVGQSPDPRGWYLSQQVPLVIRVPGLTGPGEALLTPAGHADVAPTLLGLLGVDPAPYAFLGRNLLGDPGPGPVVGEYRCWRDATLLYLRRGPALEDGECVEMTTMRTVPVSRCATGFELARRQVEVSGLVLEHDLQDVLHHRLSRRP